ncbi:MAG: ferrous iron transport protein A [Acidobacteria bacterium]|nr:ferrous iron transport protein A [Acidobacteriota bacterium]
MLTSENFETQTNPFGPASKVKLSTLGPGAEAQVAAVGGNGPISRRLQEMGVVPGVSIRVVKTAPFGDPFEVRLLGYSLAMRKNEAELVEVFA